MQRAGYRIRKTVSRRGGITIIELFVALAVVSILAALVLPAVERSRESARRMECLDHLRQLGIACQAHESALHTFPYTCTISMSPGGKLTPSISAHANLLPYVDQSSLFATINFNHYAIDNPGSPPTSTRLPTSKADPGGDANPEAMKAVIPLFFCPNDGRRPGGTNYRACLGSGPGLAGPGLGAVCRDPGDGAGAFVTGQAVRASEFKDGLGHTALFSEKLIGTGERKRFVPWIDFFYVVDDFCTAEQARTVCRDKARLGVQHDSYEGWAWLMGSWRQTWYNHVLPPNNSIPDCSAGGQAMSGGGNGVYAARSLHSAGVNVVFADGAGRFISDDIDLDVWRALGTRNGGEVLDDSF